MSQYHLACVCYCYIFNLFTQRMLTQLSIDFAVVLSQIMARVGFDFLGRPNTSKRKPSTRTMMWLVIAVWAALNLMVYAAFSIKRGGGLELTGADYASVCLINLCV